MNSNSSLKTPIIITISVVVLAIIIFLALKLLSNQNSFPQPDNETGVYIVDGDTFDTSLGESIRLLCVDAPEEGQTGYEDAKAFLSAFILGKDLLIERQGFDNYNRTLAWISVKVNEETILVNKAIVDGGYGELFEYNGTDCRRMK